MNENQNQERIEALGPAERLINALLANQDHMVHNRPGMVSPDGRTTVGVRWVPVTHKVEEPRTIILPGDEDFVPPPGS